MHLVGAHARGARRQLGVERDAPLDRLGLENVQRLRNCLIEIELPQLDRVPLQQAAQVADDLARALIVAADVGENLLQQIQVGRVLREQDLGRLGIAQDRSQRLIELMRDRSGEGARGGGPVQMNDLDQPPARLQLRRPAPVALEQQQGDQRRLQQHDGERRQHLPAVLLPYARRAKADLAAGRQPALADSEALELAPVEYGFGEIADGNRDIRDFFAVEDAQGKPRRSFADRDRRRDEATGTAMTYVGLHVDHDRPIGRVGECGKAFMRNICVPRAVERDARIYDCRIIRQLGHALPDLDHRQTDQVDEFKFVGECGDLVLVLAAYGLTLPVVADQGDSLQVRHQRSRRCHCVAKRPLVKGPGDVGRKV